MIRRIKRALTGTSLERPARAALTLARRLAGRTPPPQSPEWALRVARDEAATARLLQRVLTRTANCVDVGAHAGDFLARFEALAPDGRHVAFEALPEYARRLARDFPRVAVHPCALGAVPGRATFCHAIDMPAWSGLKTQPYPSACRVETFETEVARLDDILPADYRVDFIKVDVEGGELGVFEGAARTITTWRPTILFEHAQIHTVNYGTTAADVFDLLVGRYRLAIFSLDDTAPLDRARFLEIYDASAASNYDRHAQTNFLARPAAASVSA